MLEEEFYGTIKLVSGEEIFAEILPTQENGRTLLLLSEPVQVQTVSLNTNGIEGVKIDPWIKSQGDAMRRNTFTAMFRFWVCYFHCEV